MNERDEDILKSYFKEDMSNSEISEGFEDRLMERIDLERSKVHRPLVSKTGRIFAIGFAMFITVGVLILFGTTNSAGFSVELEEQDLSKFLNGPVLPILGSILTFVSIDVLIRVRRRQKRS